ncbi:helix-turn-helix domain-containing protein [Telluribacter sp. SYSU D00476]|uniref:helix-turn-helix domain-containing protein n=1 Tax=Telluribacter sp. SYSU D00476 TaxID=2811430 RepID=UPI001FF43A06|nr:helix-turn-helix domain-containing protein [Telluribacter sp. SYSU D00476]
MTDKSIADSRLIRATKIKVYIEQYTEGKHKAFAELVGILPSNLSQMISGRRPISDRIWHRIHSRLGIKEVAAPRDVQGGGSSQSAATNHEGEQLRKWLIEQGIAQKELAEKLGVSTVAVHNYLKTEHFRADTLRSITDVFGVSENEILGQRKDQRIREGYLPLVKVGQRRNTKWKELSYLYVGDNYKEGGVVFELGHDGLQSPFAPGWQVIGVEVASERYKFTTGLVAVQFDDTIQIRRIRRNDIVSHGYLVLESDDPKGDIITVLKEDIQKLWTINSIIKGTLQ